MSVDNKELRLGNLLIRRGIEENIYTLGTSTINGKPEHEYNPIPLTTETIAKCGFPESEDGDGYVIEWDNEVKFKGFSGKEKLFIIINGDGTHLANNEMVIMTTQVDYLHQLQNLYFALTFKELEIKQL